MLSEPVDITVKMANQLFEYLLTDRIYLLLPAGPEIDYSNVPINEFPVDQACQ